MQIIIHRGAHEVGGSCVELSYKDTAILLDIGLPLDSDMDEDPETHLPQPLFSQLQKGEKHVDASRYTTGEDWGDNENLFCGFNNDTCRSTSSRPRRDQPGGDYKTSFGAAHPFVWQMVFCDASVRTLSYSLDPQLHRQLGHRQDRAPGSTWNP